VSVVPPVPRHPFVAGLTGEAEPFVAAAAGVQPAPVPPAAADQIPDLIPFDGFINGTVVQPGGASFWLLYRDWQMLNWMLLEAAGIRHVDVLPDDDVPTRQRDLVWVTPDTAVGYGTGTQSSDARFLTGDFTRAGNFEAPPSGGTFSATSGPRSHLCCYGRSRG
jgi:hypothetical protein